MGIDSHASSFSAPRTDATGRVSLIGPDLAAMQAMFVEHGFPAFRAKQVWNWIYKRGVRDFEAMGNLPKDMRALMASVQLGVRRMDEILSRFGADIVADGLQQLLARTRRLVRAELTKSFGYGTHRFTDAIDSDGHGNGPFHIRLAMTREVGSDGEDRFIFDATETEPPNTNSFFGQGGYAIWASDNNARKVRGCIIISSGLGSDVSKCVDMKFE